MPRRDRRRARATPARSGGSAGHSKGPATVPSPCTYIFKGWAPCRHGPATAPQYYEVRAAFLSWMRLRISAATSRTSAGSRTDMPAY